MPDRCYFSNESVGDCQARQGLDGSRQTKWYEPNESGRRGLQGLTFYKKSMTRYRNLCGRCYAEHEGGWYNDVGTEIPYFVDSPSSERWSWPA